MLGGASPTRWCRASARSCGSSTSTASRSTGSCPTSPPGGWPTMFEAAGWHVETVKYGRACASSSSARRRGAARAHRRHGQRGVPAAAARRRRRAARAAARRATRRDRARDRRPRRRRAAAPRSATSAATTSGRCSTPTGRPTRSPTARRSSSPTRSRAGGCRPRATRPTTPRCSPAEQYEELAARSGADPDDPWRGVRRRASPEAELCAAAARAWPASRRPPRAPPRGARATSAATHTRLGLDPAGARALLRRPRHEAPEVAAPRRHRVARTSAPSTNLGGWINQRRDLVARRPDRLVRRRHATRSCAGARPSTAATSSSGSPRSTSSACWASSARRGRATASRCCRSGRSTTRSSTARSSRGRSASTPAASRSSSGPRRGVTLGPEGGAHQSIMTPSIGHRAAAAASLGAGLRAGLRVGLPARPRAARPPRTATSAYFRLSTRPLDQALAACPTDAAARERRRHVLAGGYRLRPAPAGRRGGARRRGRDGARGVRAADELERSGARARSSASRAPTCSSARCQARAGLATATTAILAGSSRRARARSSPCSTATRTRSPSSAAVHGVPDRRLGVTDFGQSGDIADLYAHYGLDAETIVGAALDLAG